MGHLSYLSHVPCTNTPRLGSWAADTCRGTPCLSFRPEGRSSDRRLVASTGKSLVRTLPVESGSPLEKSHQLNSGLIRCERPKGMDLIPSRAGQKEATAVCWWKKKKNSVDPTPTPEPPPPPPPPSPPKLLHPEEPSDSSRTIANTTAADLAATIQAWKDHYQVPASQNAFWDTMHVELSAVAPAGGVAATDCAAKHMWVEPPWMNPGVIAHEMSHYAYWQLTQRQKNAYADLLSPLRISDPVIMAIPNLNASDVEAYADIYRYQGSDMPESLKAFYKPYLF